MIIAVCVDDKLGLSFFGKRQSRDKNLITDLLKMGKIYITPYSKILFSEQDNVEIVDNFSKLNSTDILFLESQIPSEISNKIDGIILYRWNRVYPADKFFNILLKDYKLQQKSEFAGSSHDTITKEVYTK